MHAYRPRHPHTVATLVRVLRVGGITTLALSTIGGGYLVADGPPPLRFGTRPKAAATRTALPPLALTTPESSDSTNDLSNAGSRTDPTLDATEPGQGGDELLGSSSEKIVIPPAASSSPSLFPGMSVSPQVLLSYFASPGTNGTGAVVVAPVSFVPPQPGPPPSSRAVYRKVP